MAAFTNEHGVAGAILVDPSCLESIAGKLRPEHFAGELSRSIFVSALALADKNMPVDILTIQAESKRRGVVLEQQYLTELMDITPTAANVEYYAAELVKESQSRRLHKVAMDLIAQLEAGAEPSEIAQSVSEETGRVMSADGSKVKSAAVALAELYQDICSPVRSVQKLKTGFANLDELLGGGLIKGGLYILAGRPGMGKTTLALAMAEEVADRKKKVLFVSLEMDEKQISAKRLARKASVSYSAVYGGKPSAEQLKSLGYAAAELSGDCFMLTDNPELSVRDIAAVARSIKDLDFVIVDYMGLISSPGHKGSLYEKITEISRQLKVMAMQLGVPVLALAQLNREVAGTQDKRPKLHQLRDSGAIEQDADGVIFFHRPDYFEDVGTKPISEIAEIIVAKNRHGATGKVDAIFYGATGRIYERERRVWNKTN